MSALDPLRTLRLCANFMSVVGYLHILAAAGLALLHGSAIDAPEISAGITLDTLVLRADAPAPFLSERGWVVDNKLAADPKRELLDWARRNRLCAKTCAEGAFMYVSLGPNPTFGAFLRTARSLRRMGLCQRLFVKEGGKIGVDNHSEMLSLNVC